MQLWLAPRAQPHTRIHPPAACPRPGCGGRRFHLHQVVAKSVRDLPSPPTPRRVIVHRYTCRRCRRTFRMYPAGVGRGGVSVGVQCLAAALHLLGLSFRDVSRALALLGVAMGKSQAQALVAPRLRGLARRGVAPLLKGVEAVETETGTVSGQPAAWIWIHGRRLTLRRAVDHRGRAALVVDDIDRETYQAVERWVRGTLTGFGVDVDVVFPVLGAKQRRAMLAGLEVGQGDAAEPPCAGVGVGQAAHDEAPGSPDVDGGGSVGEPPAPDTVIAAIDRARRGGGLIGVRGWARLKARAGRRPSCRAPSHARPRPRHAADRPLGFDPAMAGAAGTRARRRPGGAAPRVTKAQPWPGGAAATPSIAAFRR